MEWPKILACILYYFHLFITYALFYVMTSDMYYDMYMGNNFVSDGHVCNTFCPALLKLVNV